MKLRDGEYLVLVPSTATDSELSTVVIEYPPRRLMRLYGPFRALLVYRDFSNADAAADELGTQVNRAGYVEEFLAGVLQASPR